MALCNVSSFILGEKRRPVQLLIVLASPARMLAQLSKTEQVIRNSGPGGSIVTCNVEYQEFPIQRNWYYIFIANASCCSNRSERSWSEQETEAHSRMKPEACLASTL